MIRRAAQKEENTMPTPLPTRQQVDAASDLDFDATRSTSKAHISIELAPDGLHVTCEYLGSLSSIPAAIARLEAAGLVELVEKYRAAPAAAPSAPHPAPRAKAQTVEPFYRQDGTACCPVHTTPLSQGSYGLYCSTKAKPGESANPKGYCNLRFA